MTVGLAPGTGPRLQRASAHTPDVRQGGELASTIGRGSSGAQDPCGGAVVELGGMVEYTLPYSTNLRWTNLSSMVTTREGQQ